jgi:hypothetical protein
MRGALFLLPLIAAPVLAQVGRAESRPAGYRTFIETFLLDRSPTVVRARFEKTDDLVGVQVTVFSVKAALRGPRIDRLVVAGAGPLVAEGRTGDQLLFAEPLSSGVLHRLVDVVDLAGDSGAETEALVRQALKLADATRTDVRREGIRKLVFDALAARGEFARKLGAREFVRAAGMQRGLFTAVDLPALHAASPKLPTVERPGFLEALGELEAARLENFAGAEKIIPSGRERELFLLALEALREAPGAAERGDVVDQIARRFGRLARPFLAACVADVRPDVRRAGLRLAGVTGAVEAAPGAITRLIKAEGAERVEAVECLGRLGIVDAAPSLAARWEFGAADSDAILVALARIGGPTGRRLLEDLGRRAASDPRTAAAAARVTELLRPEWSERDAAARAEEARAYLKD